MWIHRYVHNNAQREINHLGSRAMWKISMGYIECLLWRRKLFTILYHNVKCADAMCMRQYRACVISRSARIGLKPLRGIYALCASPHLLWSTRWGSSCLMRSLMVLLKHSAFFIPIFNNPVLTLQLGILGKLLWLMGRIVKGCVREVSLAQVSCILMLLRPHQWVRGRWPWGYGSVLSIIIHLTNYLFINNTYRSK